MSKLDLYENYRNLASAILAQYAKDYIMAHVYTSKHTERALEDKINRSESAARKAYNLYGPESQEYADAMKLVRSYKWKYSVYTRCMNTLDNVEYEIRTGSLSTYFHLLGYKLDDETILNRLEAMARNPSKRRAILKQGKPEVELP